MIRTFATGLLCAGVLATTAGCIPAPFEQDVPSTSWQVDEKGNKTKITNPGKDTPASGKSSAAGLTDVQQVKKTADAFYVSVYSEKAGSAFQEASAKVQSANLPSDPVAMKKAQEKIAPEIVPLLKPVTDYMDTAGMSPVEIVDTATPILMLGGMAGGADMKVTAPVESIKVTGDTATLDTSKLKVTMGGEPSDSVASQQTSLDFVKKDGKWLIDGKKTHAAMAKTGQ